MPQVVTHVPATTANLGPGYDCLGIALALGNRVTVERIDSGSETEGMVGYAAERFFSAASVAPFGFTWLIEGEVPQSRGMGSSVTVRLGILHGLNELSGRPLDAFQIFML
jgi:homoserine kinase